MTDNNLYVSHIEGGKTYITSFRDCFAQFHTTESTRLRIIKRNSNSTCVMSFAGGTWMRYWRNFPEIISTEEVL